MQPRLTTQASAARSLHTTSSAVRPLGKRTVAVLIQAGRGSGARFWKNGSLPAPLGNRFRFIGRSTTPRSAASATLT
jgi:hypothetical protein